ncbi:unnamed protein product [Paramecium sonneborni]|uniref:RRM domain-containing protein n=1 Tax=Paramecium sonneborni TaxID=65129 RepID=A0A8S1QAI9_9CILI|nr:unnamed protein product [Paramecium sonneborni]
MKKQFQFLKKNKDWQQEFQDIDDQVVLEKIQLPPSEDEEQPIQQKEQVKQEDQQKVNEIEIVEEKEIINEKSNEKQKKIEWLDSDIEGIDDIDDDEEQIDDDINEIDHDQKTIFVQGLPLKISDKEIVDFFSQFGTIVSIEIPRNEGSQFTKRRAFIEYSTLNEAQSVTKLDLELKTCTLKIRIGLQQKEQDNQVEKNEKKNRSRSRSRSLSK